MTGRRPKKAKPFVTQGPEPANEAMSNSGSGQEEVLLLSPADQKAFVSALLDPPPMAPAMIQAFEHLKRLDAKEAARAMLEARIQILVEEAVATSAIEGIHLDRKEVRKAVLLRLAQEEGLL